MMTTVAIGTKNLSMMRKGKNTTVTVDMARIHEGKLTGGSNNVQNFNGACHENRIKSKMAKKLTTL